MKHTLVLFVVVLVVLAGVLLPFGSVFSDVDTDQDPKPAGITNPLGSEFQSLGDFIAALVRVARDIGMLVAVLGIVYAGFLKVTARGDEEKLQKANKAFLWAVLGTAVLLGAWLIALSIQGTVKELEASALLQSSFVNSETIEDIS